jgi:hypothetical protein
VIHELWTNDEGLDMFCLGGEHGDAARKLLEPDYKLVWTCEAGSHFEAMTIYYQFRGYGEFITEFIDEDKKTYKELGWE